MAAMPFVLGPVEKATLFSTRLNHPAASNPRRPIACS